MKYLPLDIRRYKDDGLVKLCQVEPGWYGRWIYKNMDEKLMYSNHASWVYFIVVDNEIVKVGETGNPLGIRTRNSDQPSIGTKCRMGRLANLSGAGDTDGYIREQLETAVAKHQVTIWVRKCKVIHTKITIGGIESTMDTAYHKAMEMEYLDLMRKESGGYPILNKGRK